MKLSVTLVVAALSLTGCGAVHISSPLGSGPAAKASPPAARTNGAEPKSSETAVTSATGTAPSTPSGPSNAEREAEDQLKHLNERAEEIAKTGKVFADEAVSGFSPDERRAFIVSLFKAPEKPSEALLARVDAALAKQRAAAESAAKPENIAAKSATPDPGAERAIRKEIEGRLKGVQIKSVKMVDSSWKVNHNDYGVVRNRYKNAEVLLAIKGTKTCIAYPANAAQASMGDGTFAADYDHDQFLAGYAAPCP